MPRLKYFNEDTQQWEHVFSGGQGPAGADGADGQMYGNFDGGDASSVYGGIVPVDGGDAGSF